MTDSDDIANILGSLEDRPNPGNALRELIGFDLSELSSVEVADARKALRWDGDWKIRLDSGREVYIGCWHQYAMYPGMLAGIPTDVVSYLLEAQREARRLIAGDTIPVVILKPVLQSLPLKPERDPMAKLAPILPPICTIARLNSWGPARDPDEDYSSLVTIWFTHRFGLPDDEDILSQLRALDWDRRAADWSL